MDAVRDRLLGFAIVQISMRANLLLAASVCLSGFAIVQISMRANHGSNGGDKPRRFAIVLIPNIANLAAMNAVIERRSRASGSRLISSAGFDRLLAVSSGTLEALAARGVRSLDLPANVSVFLSRSNRPCYNSDSYDIKTLFRPTEQHNNGSSMITRIAFVSATFPAQPLSPVSPLWNTPAPIVHV